MLIYRLITFSVMSKELHNQRCSSYAYRKSFVIWGDTV